MSVGYAGKSSTVGPALASTSSLGGADEACTALVSTLQALHKNLGASKSSSNKGEHTLQWWQEQGACRAHCWRRGGHNFPWLLFDKVHLYPLLRSSSLIDRHVPLLLPLPLARPVLPLRTQATSPALWLFLCWRRWTAC